MEFFAGELREPDERLLATMDTLGSQVGQFVAGRRAAEEVQVGASPAAGHARGGSDAVVTIDAAGRVLGWDHAAEAISATPRARPTGARWPSRSSSRPTCATPIAAAWRASCRQDRAWSSTAGWRPHGNVVATAARSR